MDFVEIYVKNTNKKYIVDENTTFYEFSKRLSLENQNILLAKVDNELEELNSCISKNCTVEFLDISDANGYRTYQRGVEFIMILAVKELYGEKANVRIEHSINKNIYCNLLDIEVTDEVIKEIKSKMDEIVERNYEIERISVPVQTGMELFERFGLTDMAKALKFVRNSTITMYRVGWFYDYFYGHMPPSTGCLKSFDIVKSDDRFLICLPDKKNPSQLNGIKSLKKVRSVFKESADWASILNINTAYALNKSICDGSIRDIILISEALHEKKIAQIADEITTRKKNIILLAGPSSSGKTTSANRLCTQLKVNGLKPYVISLDDYYLNRVDCPRGEDGKPDFEILEALDIKKFNEDMLLLLEGQRIELPKFNFRTGMREYVGNFISLGEKEVLVIEGIHGLNDKLTKAVPQENKFKIYVSAMTQLNIDGHNRVPTTDARLIRRIVRDHYFRGFEASSTIAMWPTVNKGERENIFPYQEEADMIFNSSLVYELCVLKQLAEPLLFNISKESDEYIEATRLLKFLDCFLAVNKTDTIPPNSIIREFIGGGCFNQ